MGEKAHKQNASATVGAAGAEAISLVSERESSVGRLLSRFFWPLTLPLLASPRKRAFVAPGGWGLFKEAADLLQVQPEAMEQDQDNEGEEKRARELSQEWRISEVN